jgi:hypothetical protein
VNPLSRDNVRSDVIALPRPRPRERSTARLGLVLLAFVCLVSAHEAVYAAHHGIGPRLEAVLAASGHAASHVPALLLAALAALALLSEPARRFERARRELRRLVHDRGGWSGPSQAIRSPATTQAPTYLADARGLWLRLMPITVAGYAVQENAEHLAGHGHVPGLEVLAGGTHPFALPVLALVCAAIALVGALVRHRIVDIETRLARALASWQRAHLIRIGSPDWRSALAEGQRAQLLSRPDAGRAPPLPA